MKRYVFATVAAVVLSTATIGLASSASAMPTGPASVQDTVQQLQASGYTVVMNKTGNAPLQNCTISAVRPGQTVTRMDSGVPGAGTDHITTVVSRTVYVDVSC